MNHSESSQSNPSQGFALITGASAGLGEEFAKQLAAMGRPLILVARRLERLERIADALRTSHQIEVKTIAADLSLAGAAEHIASVCTAEGWQVDWLINNAGIAGPDLLQDRDWPTQQHFFQLMMLSAADLSHRFVPGMAERGYGRVINVASVAARVPRSEGATTALPRPIWSHCLKSSTSPLLPRESTFQHCARALPTPTSTKPPD